MSKEEELRAMREARFAKNSRGSRESRPAPDRNSPEPRSSSRPALRSMEASGDHGNMLAVSVDKKKAGVASSPREAKRGRPRIGEQPDKPWLKCKPPISERTWYRRQREKTK